MNDPLPTECKDLAFARNLIAQMKGEGGRHNSTVNSARVSTSVANRSVESQQMRAPAHGQQDRVGVDLDVNASPPLIARHHIQEYIEAMRRLASDRFGIPPGFFERARSMIEQGNLRLLNESFGDMWYGQGTAEMPYYPLPFSVGRWGNRYIQSGPECCSIGDAFLVKEPNGPETELEWYGVKPFGWHPIETEQHSPCWKFKKVSVTVTPDNGQTWHEEHFWERVE